MCICFSDLPSLILLLVHNLLLFLFLLNFSSFAMHFIVNLELKVDEQKLKSFLVSQLY